MLDWFAANGSDYPWRHREDDPYAVWVSEVMLQQTQASRVAIAFPAFMRRFPDVASLAEATRADVVRAWAGMGYHRRAVALHEASRRIVDEHAGVVPDDPATLLRLPGIGPYTAAAVASIAYGVPAAAVDTNVRKVVARVDHGVERDEITPARAQASADAWLDRSRPGDWNQALMSLGRSVCRTAPRCEICPLATGCRFLRSGRTGRASTRRQPAFEGSTRQVRGRVVAALRARSSMTVAELAAAIGRPDGDIRSAVVGLARDGVVQTSFREGVGDPADPVRLAEEPVLRS